MEEMVLRRIGFGAYVKFFTLSGFGSGVVMGIILLLIGLSGGPVTANLGTMQWTGATAGVMSLVIGPVISAFIFGWFSVFMYLPFRLALKVFDGIKIKATIRMISQPDTQTDTQPEGLLSCDEQRDNAE